MKKIILTASLAIAALSITAFINPKTASDNQNFEGVITYSIGVDNPQMAQYVGSSMKAYIKGSKIKMIQDGSGTKTIFSDRSTTDQPVVLLDAMGNKYQIKMDKQSDEKDPAIKYVDETKTIAGYTCHKAEITGTDMQGQPYTSEVYYTEDIVTPPAKSGHFKSLKGFPLQYSMPQMGVKVTFTATKVDKQPLSDDTFTIPSGYKLMTMEEIMADMQKNMSGGQ